MKKILITGASGFLGVHLIEAILRETDHEVIALTSRPEKLRQQFPDAGNRMLIIDNADRSAITWREVDVLVNCAFPRNDDGTKMAEGLKYIADILSEAANGGVGAVINISSQSVYSQSRTEPATEETPLNLESKYAVGKYASELLTNTICADIPHTNLRLASLIGPEFDQRVTNKLIEKALAGEDLTILTGSQTYGFLDVRDAANALVVMLQTDTSGWAEVYNLGTNELYHLEDIAEIICSIYNENCNKSIGFNITYSEKQFNSSLDVSKFQKYFQWNNLTPLYETLKWIFDYKNKNLYIMKGI